LQLYGRIKGVPEKDLAHFVDKMLDKLSLRPWADVVSSAYSGGNRRKLSVGIALIGNPPIVYLDEPSSGMDPSSRRSMWDLISSTMAGRAVILTTHSMEECEALCSRIGIMVSGRLQCLGTAHHLKQRFGQGYQLDVTIGFAKAAQAQSAQESKQADPDGNVADGVEMQTMTSGQLSPGLRLNSFVITDMPEGTAVTAQLLEKAVQNFQNFIQANFAGSKLIEVQANRLKFRIPSNIMSLGQLFTTVEKCRDVLHVEEYSVSQTTLEQIFVHFAKMQSEERVAAGSMSP